MQYIHIDRIGRQTGTVLNQLKFVVNCLKYLEDITVTLDYASEKLRTLSIEIEAKPRNMDFWKLLLEFSEDSDCCVSKVISRVQAIEIWELYCKQEYDKIIEMINTLQKENNHDTKQHSHSEN